jgi:CRP-like cAMP-binding protein
MKSYLVTNRKKKYLCSLVHKRMIHIEDLFCCPVCSGIPAEEREAFLNSLHYRLKRFKKSELVATQGDEVNFLYILLQGSVKTEMISEAGTTLYIETLHAPYPLASAFLFAQPNRFPVDVIAIEDCEVALVSKESLWQQLSRNEAFLQAYMAFNANRTQFLSQRLKIIPLKTIKGKLAMYIMQRQKGLTFEMDMNQTQLAEYFGVARPSLARSLAEITAAGIITLNRRQGKILDINRLKELIV